MTAGKVTFNTLALPGKTDYITCSTPAAPLPDMRNPAVFSVSYHLITAAQHINMMQVLMNFEIGRRIVEDEQKGAARADYGKQILVYLSLHLSAEFGRGFSRSNLEYMRKFYRLYKDRRAAISQKASGKSVAQEKNLAKPAFLLSWSHYVFLMGIGGTGERSFYEIEAAQNGWSLLEMRRQFDSGLYERLALSRDKEGVKVLAAKGQVVAKPEDIIKDPIFLPFPAIRRKTRFC